MNRPKSFEEIQVMLTQLENRLVKLETRDIDLHQRRVINAASAQDQDDYVTLKDLSNQLQTAIANAASGNGSGSGSSLPATVSHIQDEGINLPSRNTINFIGLGVTATDDVVNHKTNVTIPGQTPWTGNVNGGGFTLTNVSGITTGGIITTGSGTDIGNKLNCTAASGRTYVMYSSGGGSGLGNGVWTVFDETAGSPRLIIGPGGNFGVNIGFGSLPAYQLHLSVDSAGKPGTSTWSVISTLLVKQNVRNLIGGLPIINQIRPIEAEYNGKANTPFGQRIVSVIAEEIQKILPGTVSKDGDGNLSFNLHEVLFHMILAIQQLDLKIKGI